MRGHRTFTEPPHGDRNDWRNLRAILPYMRDYYSRVLFAIGCLILAKLATVGAPLLLKEIVDHLDTEHGPIVLPMALFLGYGALRLTNSLFNELRDVIFARVRYHAMRRLSRQVMQHLFDLGLRFHYQRKTGGISRDIDRGTRSVADVINMLSFNILPTVLEFGMVGGILLAKYPARFAVVTLLCTAIYIVFTLWVTEWRLPFRLRMNKLDSSGNTQAIDSLINYETVKYFGNERYELGRYDETLSDWEDAAVKSQSSLAVLNIGQGIIIATGVTLLMLFAGQGVAAGAMSLGDLVLVNALLLQLFLPLNFLGTVYRLIRHAFADMDLLFKLLGETPEISDRPDAVDLQWKAGAVSFERVSFAYESDRPILSDIDFSIKPSQKIALVGASGAGKSTVARLLFRFYEVNQGHISIDGQDIRDVKLHSLRQVLGVVPQDTVLFNASIYFNIGYAKPGVDAEEIYQAARMAQLHDFILSLPKGYDTQVGERGLKLSGGEKQRVAIARVILKGARILVFDEATSSLDSKTEQAILDALREVAKGYTTLVIAHRLSTITDADEILVMENGKIIERGDHNRLLEVGGSYARMWELQQREQGESSGPSTSPKNDRVEI